MTDGRYPPSGEIAFLSTRQASLSRRSSLSLSAMEPRPMATSAAEGTRGARRYLVAHDRPQRSDQDLSLENFEWTPSVPMAGSSTPVRLRGPTTCSHGPLVHAPDGTNARAVRESPTRPTVCFRGASGAAQTNCSSPLQAITHHRRSWRCSIRRGRRWDGAHAGDPEVCFPRSRDGQTARESLALSETCWLTAWSDVPLGAQGA